MRRVDLHPEELWAGRLNASDAARRAAHLGACAPCWLEHLAVGDFARDAVGRTETDPMVDAVLRTIGDVKLEPRAHRRIVPAVAAAAALLIGLSVSGAVAAVAILRMRAPRSEQASAAHTAAPQERPAQQAPPKIAPVAPVVVAEPADRVPVLHRVTRPAEEPPAPVAALPSASELFAAATRLRRDGECAQALAQYRSLSLEYPSSREAINAHVVTGSLLLDRMGQPGGGAWDGWGTVLANTTTNDEYDPEADWLPFVVDGGSWVLGDSYTVTACAYAWGIHTATGVDWQPYDIDQDESNRCKSVTFTVAN